MSGDTSPTEAGQRYATALAVHYTAKDLRVALSFYRDILSDFPDTEEAGYARSQIRNIVQAVVPRQVLLDAQADLAMAYFDHKVRSPKVVELRQDQNEEVATPGSDG